MRRDTQGSALLVVLILMALLLSVLGLATQTTFFMQSLSHDFHKTQNRTCITQTLLAYAITLARDNYDEFLKYSDPIRLTLQIGQQHATLEIVQRESNLALEAVLYEGAGRACSMSCTLVKDTENKFQVQCFQR